LYGAVESRLLFSVEITELNQLGIQSEQTPWVPSLEAGQNRKLDSWTSSVQTMHFQ